MPPATNECPLIWRLNELGEAQEAEDCLEGVWAFETLWCLSWLRRFIARCRLSPAYHAGYRRLFIRALVYQHQHICPRRIVAIWRRRGHALARLGQLRYACRRLLTDR